MKRYHINCAFYKGLAKILLINDHEKRKVPTAGPLVGRFGSLSANPLNGLLPNISNQWFFISPHSLAVVLCPQQQAAVHLIW
jgi:hypothetical protein